MGDTLNQGFLLASLGRSERPPDRRHPFGYGNERYVWSLLAAFGIFVAGAGFSIFYGILTMMGRGGTGTSVWLAYAVLGLAAVLEGTSWIRALYQARMETRADGRGIVEHVRRSPDLTFKAALFEDSTAMFGPEQILVAAKVNFSDDISADQAEDVAGEIDRRLRERLPTVRHVFLDPTQRTARREEPA
ncbi:cation diffusion facilitator family transporter [Actinomadura sp. 3N407]|uniref:cation diffusion facilitator family transporter n=1 Tax=Actinomadura sp. 3N407 TaxID=3457423 RepID=UPI003FCC7F69